MGSGTKSGSLHDCELIATRMPRADRNSIVDEHIRKPHTKEKTISYRRVVITKYGGSDVLQVPREEALPEPGSGEVRVLATSACFTDTMIRKGLYPDVKEKPPLSPGYDMVGMVDKLGEGVTMTTVGQVVADLTVIGAYSEYICLPAMNCPPVTLCYTTRDQSRCLPPCPPQHTSQCSPCHTRIHSPEGKTE